MADAVEPLRQHMQQEAADELMRGEGHDLVPLRPLDAVVLVFERDAAGAGRDQAAVGDGDAVSVAGEIGQYRGGAGKWFFRVDNPVRAPERRQEGLEGFLWASAACSPKNLRRPSA